jgi:hypothetical protein
VTVLQHQEKQPFKHLPGVRRERRRPGQHNAFHTTLRLLHYGLLPVVPGRATTPVHLVSGRYATEAIAALLADGDAAGTYHVTGGAVTLGEVLDRAWCRFDDDPSFRRRRLLRPLFVDLPSFETLATEAGRLDGSVLAGAMAALGPFARQLYVAKHLDTARTGAVLQRAGVPGDDTATLVDRTIDHLVATRWGRLDGRAA